MSEDVKESIGCQLKSRREELGYSLKDAAERTRIRKSYIECLEEGRFSSLPGEAYVTGFIKVYAGYLGLDHASLLSALEDRPATPVTEPPTQLNVQHSQNTSSGKKTSSGWGAFFVGFIVVLIMGGGLYFLLAKDDTKTLPEEPPVAVQKEDVAESTSDPVDEVSPAIEEEQPPVTEVPEAEVDVDVIKERSRPQKPLATIEATGSSLRMLAVSDGSLIIEVDQRRPNEYTLHEGLDLTWKVREKVVLTMAKAGQARFWLDGVELKLGDRESLQITHAP